MPAIGRVPKAPPWAGSGADGVPTVVPDGLDRPRPGNDPTDPAIPGIAAEGDGGERYRDLRVLGSVGDEMLICETRDGIRVLHLAKARAWVLRARLLADRARQTGTAERLLQPVVVDLPRAQVAALVDHAELLASLQVELLPFGPGTIAVTAVPAALPDLDIRRAIADLAQSVAREGDRAGRCIDVLTRHGSVVAGTPTDHQLRTLLAALDEVDAPADAFSGVFTLAELRRRVGSGR